MPGSAVRFDYQSLDVGANRLYISHMDDNHLVVFDVRTQKVLANVPGVAGSTGVLAVPQLKRVYASESRVGKVAVIDQQRLQVIARVPAGSFPDGIAYDPGTRRLFVSDESGGSDIVIDTHTNRQIASIRLGRNVGNTQYDPNSHLIFATVGDRSELVSIDPRSIKIAARYPLPGSDGPHGLYIYAAMRLAFVACEGNARLLVVDMRTMKVAASFHVGDDPDVLALDPGLGRLYIACESGIVSIFDLKNRTLIKRGDPFIAREAHTIAVDPRTHKVYIPLESLHGKPVLRIMRPA